MPTYEYACRTCGEHLDVVQSFHDDPLTVCAACGGELRRVFGNVGIVFKGSGFYKTDSRSTNGKKTAPAESSSDASTPAPAKVEPSSPSPAPAAAESKPVSAAP